VYEHVRAFLRAVIYGEDEAAALSKRPEQSGALTRKDGAKEERVCFLPFEELSAKLEAALKAAPDDVSSLFEEDGAASVLQDALAVFEGEGLVIHAAQSRIVHLVPNWLVGAVEGLANHRFDASYGEKEQEQHIRSVADDWEQDDIGPERDESVDLLREYALNGIASEALLRAFFAPAMSKFGATFEQLLTIFTEQELLFKVENDDTKQEKEPEYIVPIRLSDVTPEGFENECKLTESIKACQITGTFGCKFLPPGFTQRLIAAMHKFGNYHRHYAHGGIIKKSEVNKNGPRRIFLFDLQRCQIYLRVQQFMPDKEDEDDFMESLMKLVHEMRKVVSTVAKNWQGLGLEFEKNLQIDIGQMNQETSRALASNQEELDTRELNEFEVNVHTWKSMDRVALEQIVEKFHTFLRKFKAADAEAYRDAWEELSNADMGAAEKLSQSVHELKIMVGKAAKTEDASPPCQTADIESIEQLRAAADAAGPKLHAFGECIAKQCAGGVRYKSAPTKGEERIREKTRTDYRGDCRRIVDAARGSIICETLAELAAAIRVLLADETRAPMVVRVKDRLYEEPASGGYRDVMLNVEIEGHVCELQLHLAKLIAIKSKAHRVYQMQRSAGWEGEV
jgi:hypothetical protein